MRGSDPFSSSVVVLTGASSGIGREMALQLADRGARLALAARGAGRLEKVAAACRERGGEALSVPTDVGDRAACSVLIDAAVERWGRLDVLIANAGISMWARFDELEDPGIFEEILRVNFLGAVWCTHSALPHLKEARGRLVGVSSLTGKTGVPTRSGYAASKHAMAGFFDTLRIELLDSGVTVTMAYPDFVATEIRERAYGPDGRPLGTSPVQEGRVMSAELCARRILRAAERREREIVMSARGRLGLWLKLLAPGVVDRIAQAAIRRGR